MAATAAMFGCACVRLVLVLVFGFMFGLWFLFACVRLPRWLANRASSCRPSYWLNEKGAQWQLYFERTTTCSKYLFMFYFFFNFLNLLFIEFINLFCFLYFFLLFVFFYLNLFAWCWSNLSVASALLRNLNLIFYLICCILFFFSFLFLCYPMF